MNYKKIRNSKDLKNYYNQLFLDHKESYLTAQQSSRRTQETRMYYLLHEINLKNNHRILDFGCGTAHFYEYLKKSRKFPFYTGIDIADKIIRFNKKKYSDNKKVNFIN